MSECEIYTRLIDWLRQTWWGLPAADELMPMIAARYTPDEAALLTEMPFSSRNLDELAEIKGISPAELGPRMDALARKGVVFRAARGETIRYSLNDSFFVFYRSAWWPGRTDEASKTIAPLMNQYHLHGFMDQYAGVQAKGLRTLPIERTIQDPRQVLPYEDVAQVLDAQGYFSVSVCACKHRKNLDPDSPDCMYPTKVCLHFGKLGQYIGVVQKQRWILSAISLEKRISKHKVIFEQSHRPARTGPPDHARGGPRDPAPGRRRRAGSRRVELAAGRGHYMQLLQMLLFVPGGVPRAEPFQGSGRLQLLCAYEPRHVQRVWFVRREAPDGGAASPRVASSPEQGGKGSRTHTRFMHRMWRVRAQMSHSIIGARTPRGHRRPAAGCARLWETLSGRPPGPIGLKAWEPLF